MNLTPSQLDNQSPVHIDEWLELDSEKHKAIDDNRPLTKKWLSMFLDGGELQLDKLGRVWGRFGNNDHYSPYHIESNNKLYGFKISKKAAN